MIHATFYCHSTHSSYLIFYYFSPIKVLRAKLTEEVNNRLVALGIDPFKCRLPQSIFQNQRTHLQQLRDLKSKVRINI